MTVKIIYQTKHPYFVTINVAGRFPLFDHDAFAEVVAEEIKINGNYYDIKIYGYTIMPDHLHLLFSVNENITVSDFVRNFKSFVYKNMKDEYKIEEKFWQKRYNYRIINEKEYLYNIIKYIKNNPVKRELPDKYHKYPYMFFDKEKIVQIYKKYNNERRSSRLRSVEDVC